MIFIIMVMKDLIKKLLGYKQIKCIKCGLLVWVKKDHHWLRPCPKCQEQIDGITYMIKDVAGLLP